MRYKLIIIYSAFHLETSIKIRPIEPRNWNEFWVFFGHRDCVKRVFNGALFVFPPTHERDERCCASFQAHENIFLMTDLFRMGEKNSWGEAVACVWARFERRKFMCELKVHRAISLRKLHLLNAKQITDKLLNASAVIKACRITCEMWGRSLNYVTLRLIVINHTWITFQISFDRSSSWTPTCAALLSSDVISRRPPNHFNELPVKCFLRTFYWIVGHLCGSSCCWNCCSFLHIRFCKMKKEKRKLSKNSWISRELFFFKNKQKLFTKSSPPRGKLLVQRKISEFVLLNRWFNPSSVRTWKFKSARLAFPLPVAHLFRSAKVWENIFQLFLIAL